MKTVVVIPAFNEERTIADVIRGVSAYGTPLVIDDASQDGTGQKAKAAGAAVLRLEINQGYETALEMGFAQALELGAETIVTFDADGQLDPATLPSFLAPIEEGRADISIGVRQQLARISERLFSLYTKMRFGVSDILCGVKAYRSDLYRRHGRFDNGRSVGTELALASLSRGARPVFVPVSVRPRQTGSSRYGSWLRADLKILRAMADAVWSDLRGSWRP